jgi:hypothetical protein
MAGLVWGILFRQIFRWSTRSANPKNSIKNLPTAYPWAASDLFTKIAASIMELTKAHWSFVVSMAGKFRRQFSISKNYFY